MVGVLLGEAVSKHNRAGREKPVGDWTSSHQMTLNGERDGFAMEDYKSCARVASMKRGIAVDIADAVLSTVSRWWEYADEAGVEKSLRDRIQRALRLEEL